MAPAGAVVVAAVAEPARVEPGVVVACCVVVLVHDGPLPSRLVAGPSPCQFLSPWWLGREVSARGRSVKGRAEKFSAGGVLKSFRSPWAGSAADAGG